MYLIFYSVGRFLIQMLRNDPRGTISVMSTSQFISIFTLAAGNLYVCVLPQKETRRRKTRSVVIIFSVHSLLPEWNRRRDPSSSEEFRRTDLPDRGEG